jgi:release factor glutamine methyltransferase
MTELKAADAFTIDQARRRLAQTFRHHGLDSAELDSRLLIGHVLGLDHTALAREAARTLTAAEADAIVALCARRLAREPVARIIGRKEFWGLLFNLNAETLVPRPETETVVEAALAALGRDCRARELRVADLGTGAGPLLLALLSECPAASGVGTDTSRAALACARGNARGLGLAHRAAFILADYGSALAGPFDLVMSNPPYVRSDHIVALQPEVRDFDPPRALDGGADGLDGYRAIAADARRLLAPDGILVVELGAGQLEAAAALFVTAGLAVGSPRHDLLGMARALVARALP